MVEVWILRSFIIVRYSLQRLIVELTSTFTAARGFEIH